MKLKHLFLSLAIIGAFVPLFEAFPLIYVFGFQPDIFVDTYKNSRLLFLNSVEGRFVTGVVIAIFIINFQRLQIPQTLFLIVGTFLFGVGFSLPLMFYYFERSKRR